MHSRYNPEANYADIAIMVLEKPFSLRNRDNYKTICMPKPLSYANEIATVIGYGSTLLTQRASRKIASSGRSCVGKQKV